MTYLWVLCGWNAQEETHPKEAQVSASSPEEEAWLYFSVSHDIMCLYEKQRKWFPLAFIEKFL